MRLWVGILYRKLSDELHFRLHFLTNNSYTIPPYTVTTDFIPRLF